MKEQENEKVVLTMERHLWEDEVRAKKKYTSMKARLLILCFVLSLTALFSGYLIGNHYTKKVVPTSRSNKLAEIESVFRNSWFFGNEHEELDYELLEKAASGMSTFQEDPYTVYMSPQRQNDFISGINMNFVGLGVSIREDLNLDTYITKVYKNTPAEKNGLQAGDVFIEIDGKDVRGIGVAALQELVLGEIGTSVEVKVLRGNVELTFNIIRDAFNSSVFGENKEDFYYLTLNSFGESTYSDARVYLDEMKDLELTKLVLDLRNNTGGYLTAVSDIAGLFLDKSCIVLREIDKNGKETIQRVTGDKYDFIDKIVILQNENTASASEVLTLALREQFKDTTVVGINSYGKGLMQRTFNLSDGSYLKLTTNEWRSSNNVSINKVGVEPDVRVEEKLAVAQGYFIGNDTYKYDDNNLLIASYQIALEYLGYDVSRVDGYFDKSFVSALKEFQEDNNISVTGELNEETERQIASCVRLNYQDDKEHFDVQYIKAVELINE